MKLRINEEELESFHDLRNSDGYKVLLIVLDQLIEQQGKTVLSYSLSDGDNGLLIEKARHEGAVNLVRQLRQQISPK